MGSWRKVNELIKRAKLAKIHASLLSHLRKAMPKFGKERAKEKLMSQLPSIYKKVAKDCKLYLEDFPSQEMMQERLRLHDFSTLKLVDDQKMVALDKLLHEDIPD